jgi:hypothetical protein
MSDGDFDDQSVVGEPLNEFAPSWTAEKANMVFDYAKAYHG